MQPDGVTPATAGGQHVIDIENEVVVFIVVAIVAPSLAGHCQALPCHLQSPSEAVLVPEGAGVHASRISAVTSIALHCYIALACEVTVQVEQ